MDIKRNRTNGRYMATITGTLNGIPYTFFAQSSCLSRAMECVLQSLAEFKKQVKQFED
jgi:hypothetical protein